MDLEQSKKLRRRNPTDPGHQHSIAISQYSLPKPTKSLLQLRRMTTTSRTSPAIIFALWPPKSLTNACSRPVDQKA
ncbi:MAG: hypothetical protein Q9198_001401 [Flavoplaca austrocitrina]